MRRFASCSWAANSLSVRWECFPMALSRHSKRCYSDPVDIETDPLPWSSVALADGATPRNH